MDLSSRHGAKPMPIELKQNPTGSENKGSGAAELDKPDPKRPLVRLFETMHWLHWLVIFASLVLTLAAWHITSKQIRDRASAHFDRESAKIVELLLERMQSYEQALWAGATFIDTLDHKVDFETWRKFANGIRIDKKYPGINGIGVIHYLRPEELDNYLAEQREQRPGYHVKPEHNKDEYWPISYIVPVEGNEEAVGLDIAHEQNRYTAAQLARDTAQPQITGPITLVQDDRNSPGFLIFVPYYGEIPAPESLEERRQKLEGLVYAPFVVYKLIDGMLSRSRRHFSFSIHDGDQEIYNENISTHHGYDTSPLFQSTDTVDFYGRKWTFQFRSGLGFRDATKSAQPKTILFGGLTVNALLVLLFAQFSRSNRRAKAHARTLLAARAQLEDANEELMQFNYRTSHDLVAPLKSIQGFVDIAQREVQRGDASSASMLLDRINRQALRLDQLVQDLLNLCRIDRVVFAAEPIEMEELFQTVKASLQELALEKDVEMRFHSSLKRPLLAQRMRVQQILENLASNAIKYSDRNKSQRWVEVRASETDNGQTRLEVEDNGVGIDSEIGPRVFEMFFRVGNSEQYGSGLGNYLVMKHVSYLGGEIDYTSSPEGTRFVVILPDQTL